MVPRTGIHAIRLLLFIKVSKQKLYEYERNWQHERGHDYNDLFDFTEEDVSSMMLPAKHFIDKVANLIELP